MDLLGEVLSAVIAWVGLSSEDELHRPIVVVDDRLETFQVVEQERGTLVGCESSSEPDSENVRVEPASDLPQLVRVCTCLDCLCAQLLPEERDEICPEIVAQVPERVRVCVECPGPLR